MTSLLPTDEVTLAYLCINYDTFQRYYGPRGIYKDDNPILQTVDLRQWYAEWEKLKSESESEDPVEDGEGSDSMYREIMRDRLLVSLGREHVGYIASPTKKGTMGLSKRKAVDSSPVLSPDKKQRKLNDEDDHKEE